ncbi:MAG: hypothetical protein R3C14_54280 [Caldilineaceae bacterium]
MTEHDSARAYEIAIHEAGHAVAAYFLKRPFSSVTIVPDDDCDGHVACDGYNGNSKKIITNELITLFAADVAVRVALEDTDNFCDPTTVYDDYQAEELASRAYKSHERRIEFMRTVRYEAAELVMSTEWQAAINAVAKALVDHKELSYEQVAKVIRRSCLDW